jgi:SAM-dependent methyltransferase
MAASDGWRGWDTYAPFSDWENARTLGRRDVPYWRQHVRATRGRILELGCGTGRLLIPLSRAGATMTGIDRSEPMLQRALARARRLSRASRPRLIRGDIRHLPFASGRFGFVLAPYGMLQSLVREADLREALGEIARVLRRGGRLGIDLVPDLPSWSEYRRRVSLEGRSAGGARITLVESVRQDHRRRLTIFDEEFVERRGRRTTRHRFALTFRTLTVPEMTERLAASGLTVDRVCGDYRGGPWTPASPVWLIHATRPAR